MSDQHINLISGILPPDKETEELYKPQLPRKKKRFAIKAFIFIIILSLLFFTNVIFSHDSLLTNLGKLSFWQGVAKVVIGKDNVLKGELGDRINILILGMGGAEHEGPYLTDTIILASLKPSTKRLALLSIPRDLYVPIPGYGWRKINSANALGMINTGDGTKLTAQVIENILNLDVHYWLRVDFDMFTQSIDELGGIEVFVEKGFVDHSFPGPNFSYSTVRFDKGVQIMDGARALQFVRSRHGTNNQNSDFSRARRQQKILFAIKRKVESINLLSQPHTVWRLYSLLKNNISTNLSFNQGIALAKQIASIDKTHIITHVIETGENGLLVEEITLNGAYVLRPKNGNFKELAQFAHTMLASPVNTLLGRPASGMPLSPEEGYDNDDKTRLKPVKITVLNGTYAAGRAKQTADQLTNIGFTVASIGNAINRDYQVTTLYNLSRRSYLAQTFQDLKTLINARTQEELPHDLKPYFTNTDADFLIILGRD